MIGELLELGGKLIDRLFPDQTERDKAKVALLELQQRGELADLAGRIQVVTAEAQSNHWLAANWRPILMLVFGGLIVARWMGWSAPNMGEAEALKLWDIVNVGLGGYVMGRSAEKLAPVLASAATTILKR